MFLVVVDAHSKWPEVRELRVTTAAKTIEVLFSAYGLPEQLVTDKGPQFTSEEFALFAKQNGIKHICTSPYHPASNGAAERLVQTFKQAMKAAANNGLTLQHQLSSFQMAFHSTTHPTTGETPSKLFLGREMRTRFDLLRSDPQTRVCQKQASQKQQHNAHARSRTLSVGTTVMAKDFRDQSWKTGVVMEHRAPLTYLVQMDSGQLWRRHIDHLHQLGESTSTSAVTSSQPEWPDIETTLVPPLEMSSEPVSVGPPDNSPTTTTDISTAVEMDEPSSPDSLPLSIRYPSRQRRPVERLTY